mmetsp:Transcript_40060/g.92975  ORF Transcript_40060/g.92975 Transcript_40060/m.92975 type:complete len:223 (+) Transcript_40060:78-746(+)
MAGASGACCWSHGAATLCLWECSLCASVGGQPVQLHGNGGRQHAKGPTPQTKLPVPELPVQVVEWSAQRYGCLGTHARVPRPLRCSGDVIHQCQCSQAACCWPWREPRCAQDGRASRRKGRCPCLERDSGDPPHQAWSFWATLPHAARQCGEVPRIRPLRPRSPRNAPSQHRPHPPKSTHQSCQSSHPAPHQANSHQARSVQAGLRRARRPLDRALPRSHKQ